MKTIYKLPFIAVLLLLFAAGCTKDEKQVILQGGTAPVLAIQQGEEIAFVNAGKTALTLSWTNPNYTFNTGVSSLDVTYNIEIDTAEDFSNPAKKIISVSKDLSYTFLVSDLNDVMLNQLQLKTGMQHTLQIRVVSSMTNSSAKLTSNVLQLIATPYAIPPKVQPPSTGTLYITGDATAGGWMEGGNPASVPAAQTFTFLDSTHFTLTVNLIGGKEYLFVPVAGNWDVKYAAKSTTTPNGGEFQYNTGSNFKAPSSDGSYKIDVDFQRGVFTVTPQ